MNLDLSKYKPIGEFLHPLPITFPSYQLCLQLRKPLFCNFQDPWFFAFEKQEFVLKEIDRQLDKQTDNRETNKYTGRQTDR